MGMISEKDLERILDRYLKGTASDEEVRLIEKWYSSLDAENNFPRLGELEEESLHAEDLKHIRKKTGTQPKTVPLWPALTRVAAAVLAGLALVYFIVSAPSDQQPDRLSATVSEDEVINTSLATKTILLPDSTRVTLQPNSLIRFSNDDFNVSDRRVTLQGTASFEVSHDKMRPFKVFSYDVVTTVLGTAFTIEAPSGNEKITVAVHTGRVSVAQLNQDDKTEEQDNEIIVTPNQQVIFDPGKKDLTALLVPHPVPLQNTQASKVIFDEELITNILIDIQKSFGVEIEYDEQALRHCRITTAFSDEGLYERLDLLSKAIGADYQVEGLKIKFQGDGCSTHN